MSNGKGDTPRPLSVSNDTFASNYERTFSKKLKLKSSRECDVCPGLSTARCRDGNVPNCERAS